MTCVRMLSEQEFQMLSIVLHLLLFLNYLPLRLQKLRMVVPEPSYGLSQAALRLCSQNVAQAVVRSRSTLSSSWSGTGARRPVVSEPSNDGQESSEELTLLPKQCKQWSRPLKLQARTG